MFIKNISSMRRRAFLAGTGTTLATLGGGCLGIGDEDETVEATVVAKWLQAVHDAPPLPEQEGSFWIAIVGPIGDSPEEEWRQEWREDGESPPQELFNETHLSWWVDDQTSFTPEDLHPDVKIADFPMAEIYSAYPGVEFSRTFTRTFLRTNTDDELNENDGGLIHAYDGPTEFFDHLETGNDYTFRVGTPNGYYPPTGSARLLDILD